MRFEPTVIILISLPSYVNAHVEHYNDLNKIEFDILRNGNLIGEDIFSFKKFENLLKVKSLMSKHLLKELLQKLLNL